MSGKAPPRQEGVAPVPEPSSASSSKGKKMRSACERCRSRRIKCDGQVPACGNCFKAGVLCVDVDGREGETRVARGFSAADASARIAWLEDIIRNQLPHINLDAGPAVPAVLVRDPAATAQYPDVPPNPTYKSVQSNSDSAQNISHFGHTRGQKRSSSVLNDHPSPASSVEQDSRSMALDLGLLSLNAESRQVHYLGSSSGSLFASLFQARKIDSAEAERTGPDGSLPRISETEKSEQPDENYLDTPQYAEIRRVVNVLYTQLRKDLPSREESHVLLTRFFQHMHSNHPFLHQPSFFTMVDNIYKCVEGPPHSQIQYNGWPTHIKPFTYNGDEYHSHNRPLIPISAHVAAFQLMLALSIGATLQIRARKYTHNPTTFFKSAISLTQHVFGSISLPILQAVLLLAIHSLMDPEGCNIWLLSHIATAHAIDLGIHREVGDRNKFSALAVQMRRRIFYCTYTLDRSISTIQGRPLGFGDETFDVQLPQIDSLEEASLSQNVIGADRTDIATMPYSLQVFRMARLISKIKSRFYLLLKVEVDPVTAVMDQTQLREDLNHWLTESSAIDLRYVPNDQRTRLSIKLRIQYHAAMCLLHQPSQTIVQPDDQALQFCFDSAIQRIRLYDTLYESGSLYHSWRTVQDMLVAGVSVMYCVFISKSVRHSISLASLARDFRSCSTMLSVGGEWWPIIRKARASFERLLNHTLELVSEDVQSRSNNFPAIETVQHGARSHIMSPHDFATAEIGDALTSLISHDGHFSNIFETFPPNSFMSGMEDTTDGIAEFAWNESTINDSFWSNLGGFDFQNAMENSRSNARHLQDFMNAHGGREH